MFATQNRFNCGQSQIDLESLPFFTPRGLHTGFEGILPITKTLKPVSEGIFGPRPIVGYGATALY